jgi:hypothetical protein
VRLLVYQSLWAMGGLPFDGAAEWSLPEKIERVIADGFDGIDIAWTPTLPSAEAVAHARSAGLPYGVTCFPTDVPAFASLLETFKALDAPPSYVNIQPVPRVFAPEDGAPLLRAWIAMGEGAGFRTLIENHRNRMTTDLRFTLQLLELVPEMRLTADISHFVVGQEFGWPIAEEDDALVHRVLERADVFHGRVASREQVQISLSWEIHRPWFDVFLGWWRDGFAAWRERADPDDKLVFVTELGPPRWYAITGPDGGELSDRWRESLLLKDAVRELWAERAVSPGST